MPPNRKISDVSNVTGSVKTVKRENNNIQFTERVHTYIHQGPWPYFRSSEKYKPRKYRGMAIYILAGRVGKFMCSSHFIYIQIDKHNHNLSYVRDASQTNCE
jgi:predicted RNA-binding protein